MHRQGYGQTGMNTDSGRLVSAVRAAWSALPRFHTRIPPDLSADRRATYDTRPSDPSPKGRYSAISYGRLPCDRVSGPPLPQGEQPLTHENLTRMRGRGQVTLFYRLLPRCNSGHTGETIRPDRHKACPAGLCQISGAMTPSVGLTAQKSRNIELIVLDDDAPAPAGRAGRAPGAGRGPAPAWHIRTPAPGGARRPSAASAAAAATRIRRHAARPVAGRMRGALACGRGGAACAAALGLFAAAEPDRSQALQQRHARLLRLLASRPRSARESRSAPASAGPRSAACARRSGGRSACGGMNGASASAAVRWGSSLADRLDEQRRLRRHRPDRDVVDRRRGLERDGGGRPPAAQRGLRPSARRRSVSSGGARLAREPLPARCAGAGRPGAGVGAQLLRQLRETRVDRPCGACA